MAWQLEDSRYSVLIQAWDFVAGSNWQFRMNDGVQRATRTIAILSAAYLDSVYGQQEWQAAQAADPTGFGRKLLPIRVEDCDRPGLLHGVVSIDLFGLAADDAQRDLLDQVRNSLNGRAKPTSAPAFPARPRSAPPISKPAFPRAPRPAPAPRLTGTGHSGQPPRSAASRGKPATAAAVSASPSTTGGWARRSMSCCASAMTASTASRWAGVVAVR
ncbi:toll/interleukin-1 receptor domain-containing protein [Pseudofrankia sp. DC12]|uniref:toll/interleukin-1 receptor domain-containing protein n=1 Tax=Pseudofrankia sp. DC12 TaxID=683315 RepID=UPI0032D5A22C